MLVEVFPRVALGALFLLPTACAPSWGGENSDDAGTSEQPAEPDGGSSSGSRADGSVLGPADAELTNPTVPPTASVGDVKPPQNQDASTGSPAQSTDAGAAAATTGKPDASVPDPEPPKPPATPSEEELCKVCDAHATCSVVSGQAQCKCDKNYLGNGQTCKFDASCSSLQCSPNSDCVANEAAGSLSCECRDGYSKSGDTCMDIDECVTVVNPCKSADKPRCLNTAGSFECSCIPLPDSPNVIQNGDFTVPVLGPWVARLGADTVSWELPGQAKLESVGDVVYNDLLQNVTVQAGATYRLSAVVSADSNDGALPCSFGLRLSNSNENSIAAEFAPGSQNLRIQAQGVAALSGLQVFIGCWSKAKQDTPTFLRIDDVQLVKIVGTGICK